MYLLLKDITRWYQDFEQKWLECRMNLFSDWTLADEWVDEFAMDQGKFFKWNEISALQTGIFNRNTILQQANESEGGSETDRFESDPGESEVEHKERDFFHQKSNDTVQGSHNQLVQTEELPEYYDLTNEDGDVDDSQIQIYSPLKDASIQPKLLKFQVAQRQISSDVLMQNLITFCGITADHAFRVTQLGMKLNETPGAVCRMENGSFAVQSFTDNKRLNKVIANTDGTSLICYGQNCVGQNKVICAHIVAIILHYNFDYSLQLKEKMKTKKKKKKQNNFIDSAVNKLVMDDESISSVGRKPTNRATTKSTPKRKRKSLDAVSINKPSILLHSSTVKERLEEVRTLKLQKQLEGNGSGYEQEDAAPPKKKKKYGALPTKRTLTQRTFYNPEDSTATMSSTALLTRSNLTVGSPLTLPPISASHENTWEYLPVGLRQGPNARCKSCHTALDKLTPRVAHYVQDKINERRVKLAPKYYCTSKSCLLQGGYKVEIPIDCYVQLNDQDQYLYNNFLKEMKLSV
jgi:hypothetical protein